MGRPDSPISPHAAYLALGATPEERAATYRAFIAEGCQAIELESIRAMTSRQRAVGTEDFKRCLAGSSGRPMGLARMGRPPRTVETK
jgi:putative transposase